MTISGRLSYVEKVAEDLVAGDVTVWEISIGDGFDLRLDRESCELCGGAFAPAGQARMFYRYDSCSFLHSGCYHEVENWLPIESTFGVGFACSSCRDGCSRCGGTGVVQPRSVPV